MYENFPISFEQNPITWGLISIEIVIESLIILEVHTLFDGWGQMKADVKKKIGEKVRHNVHYMRSFACDLESHRKKNQSKPSMWLNDKTE